MRQVAAVMKPVTTATRLDAVVIRPAMAVFFGQLLQSRVMTHETNCGSHKPDKCCHEAMSHETGYSRKKHVCGSLEGHSALEGI